MRRRISIWGCVRPSVRRSVRRSVGPSVRRSVCPVLFSKVKRTHTRRILCRVSGLVLLEVTGFEWGCKPAGLVPVRSFPPAAFLSRTILTVSWKREMRKRSIPFSEDGLNIIQMLADNATIADWNIQVTLSPIHGRPWHPSMVLLG